MCSVHGGCKRVVNCVWSHRCLRAAHDFRDDMLLFDDVSQHQHPILLPYDK